MEIHERDLEKLARAGDDSEEETDVNLAPPKLELMSANSAVTLRSVDNFQVSHFFFSNISILTIFDSQGEEAKIVLLSRSSIFIRIPSLYLTDFVIFYSGSKCW